MGERVEGPDEFPLPAASPLAPQHALLSRFLCENAQSPYYLPPKFGQTPSGREIMSLQPAASRDLLLAALPRIVRLEDQAYALMAQHPAGDYGSHPEWELVWGSRVRLEAVVTALLRRKLPIAPADVEALLDWMLRKDDPNPSRYPISGVLAASSHLAERGPLDASIRSKLEKLRSCLTSGQHAESRKLVMRLEEVQGAAPAVRLAPGEVWADRARADLAALEPPRRAAWTALLAHAQSATSAKPSPKWLKAAEALLAEVGVDDFRARLLVWLPLVDKPREVDPRQAHRFHPLSIIDIHADLLRGLAWIASQRQDAELARAFAALAVSSFKKIPGSGPRAVKVGNACLWALGTMPGQHGVAQLAVVKARIKVRSAQNSIEKALTAAAERAGLSREDIEELAVPSCGLLEVGRRVETLGEHRAELTAQGARQVQLAWIGPEGKRVASVPAAVRRDHGPELKELQRAAKDLPAMLAAQADRLDRLALERKTWPLAVWRERYLDHPLVGVLARRLIWRFRPPGAGPADVLAGIHGGRAIVDAGDNALPEMPPETAVELWHPIHSLTDEIIAWRGWLEAHEVRQPFKQAHREIYLLTDAERATRTYSNRFAAHILRQHQLGALCAARGWKNKLRLLVDDEYPPPTRLLPAWGLRAEYWLEGIGTDFGTDTNEAGVFLRVATDQVRFYRLGAEQVSAHASGGGYRGSAARLQDDPLPLEQIPALVFSEVMRDVDLFVGVASIGNDPTWVDGGPGGTHRDYWHNYSFGDLSASAATRKAALERLVPRLKIAPRCSFQDRFLVVRGDLRTYKIHLGSGNILMEPDDQYLCIVKAPSVEKGEAGKVFLPFEGDGMLAVILSKAFLLAADAKITDETILQQIRR